METVARALPLVAVSLAQPPALKVTASGSTTICNGDSVTLTASGAASYLWNAGSTATSIVVKNDGLYSVTGTNGGGCSITSLVYVTVYSSPVVSITPGSNTTFCQGGYVTLNASGAATYVWSGGGTTLAITAASTGTYSVVGTDGNGCKASANKVVTVNPLPTVTFSGLGTVCHSTAAFALSGGSPSGGTYSGTGVSGGKFNPASVNTGTYTITYLYTNANGCNNTATSSITVADLTVVPGPISGPALAVCANSVKTYSVASINGATSYTWTAPVNASVTAGQGSNSVTVSYTAFFVAGTLSVVANSNCGSSTSSTLIISSTPATPASIFGDANPCRRGINTYWVNPVAGAGSYTWTVPPGSSIVSGQGTDTIIVNTGNKSGNITVKASNACGTNGGTAVKSINISCRTVDLADEMSSGNELNMTVYPNPAHGKINIKFNSSSEDNYALKIYDMTGRMVMDELKKAEIGDNIIELNTDFAKGIYIVNLTLADLNKESKIIIE